MKLNYCAEWTNNRTRDWSGTLWSLEQALSNKFDIIEIDLPRPTLIDRMRMKAMRLTGQYDFGIGTLNKQQRYVDKLGCDSSNIWFQFSEVPTPVNSQTHYIYQDLSVEWLRRIRLKDSDLYKWTGFYGISENALDKRASIQLNAYAESSGIFTMGKWLAEFLVEEVGLPQDKVHHVGGGINSYFGNDSSFRNGNTFLFCGRDFKRKGGDIVLEAFDILHSRDRELRLVIAGPVENPAPHQKGVEFLGDISNDCMGEVFSTSDVFVMPSRFEAYGLVFPEALAAGIPCVARNAFEMKNFILDGFNGRLVNSYDPEELSYAMLDCLSSSVIRDNAMNQAERTISDYSWDSVAARVFNIISSAC